MNRMKFAICTVVFGLLCICSGCGQKYEPKDSLCAKDKLEISCGDCALYDMPVVAGNRHKNVAAYWAKLVENLTGKAPEIISNAVDARYVDISINKANVDNAYLEGGKLVITATDDEACIKVINEFANAYLGCAFAGSDNAHVRENAHVINLPMNTKLADNPWMAEREPIICLWRTDTARGCYEDNNVSDLSELMDYSDDELYTYVATMKSLGFTGIQVTDMCSTWARFGNYKDAHERIILMANAAHSMGMNFTLWVWGAEFEGYGWVDDSVVYLEGPETAQRDGEKIRATFDKYYSIYAELAPYTDRLIVHYNDPGRLGTSEDIAYYAGVIRDKFLAVNPDIDFGVNCYTDQIDKSVLQEVLGNDITVYEGACTDGTKDFEKFRVQTNLFGMRLGVWSWNLTENEIDQLAEMNVNANLIKDVYKETRKLDRVMVPTYWSEMDSYHILNTFSLYVSARLLQNPDLDADALLHDAAEAVVGADYADDLYEVLDIIQDARTGENWKQFRWGFDDYLLTGNSYDEDAIYMRARDILPKLDAMIEADPELNTIPLACSVKDLLCAIHSHLFEIYTFAEFRINLYNAYNMYYEDASPEELQNYINEIYHPILPYDTVIGQWGQVEARAQYMLMERFAKVTGVEIPKDAEFIANRKMRVLGEFKVMQEISEERLVFTWKDFETGAPYGEQATVEILEMLADEGSLVRVGDGLYALP